VGVGEELTNRIETEVFAVLEKVDALGGTVKAVEEGWFQREIAESAYDTARRRASGDQPVIGVNKHVEPAEPSPVEIHKVDAAVGTRQVARTKSVRARRDNVRVQALLDYLAREAQDPVVNLVPTTMRW
jgi:methylmalonyl-CoA mutase N-terminal domain/subunit